MFPPPDPYKAVPCPFNRAWIGECGQTDRTKCKHGVIRSRNGKVIDYRNVRCSCGRPAMAECSSASSLVCGAPICRSSGHCFRHGGVCHD